MRRLSCTLARVHKTEPIINKVYALSTLYRRIRLHAPICGIGKSRKMTDRCPDCLCWDTVISTTFVTLLEENMGELTKVMPS